MVKRLQAAVVVCGARPDVRMAARLEKARPTCACASKLHKIGRAQHVKDEHESEGSQKIRGN